MPTNITKWVCCLCKKEYSTQQSAIDCEKSCLRDNEPEFSITRKELRNAVGTENITKIQILGMLRGAADRQLERLDAEGKRCYIHNSCKPHTCKEPLFQKGKHTCPGCEEDW